VIEDPDLALRLASRPGAWSDDRRGRRRRAARLHPGVLAAVGAGGALGTVARHEVVTHVATTGAFPWSVLALNCLGSMVLGFLLVCILERWPPTRYARPFAAIGFCGGLTTFSTWMVDTALLIDHGRVLTGVGYLVASIGAGVTAIYVGMLGARSLPRGKRPSG
jgi:CrcB protein